MKKIIVVTGASSGMGKEFLLQILEKEPNIDEVWAIARRKERLEELRDTVSKKIVPVSLDLSVKEDLEKYKSLLEKEDVNIKILANCAGFGKFDHIENIDTETKLNMIDLNCKAMVNMTDYSLPYMKKGSKIMNIASLASYSPLAYANIYASTKAFVRSYSYALHDELKYRGIHVLTVAPYWTKTEFFDRAETSKKKTVVIKYEVMYDAAKVMKKAIKDLYNDRKYVSSYGVLNYLSRVFIKISPYSFIRRTWFGRQKFDGTPDIRKDK